MSRCAGLQRSEHPVACVPQPRGALRGNLRANLCRGAAGAVTTLVFVSAAVAAAVDDQRAPCSPSAPLSLQLPALRQLLEQAGEGLPRARAQAALGGVLLQLARLAEAEPLLQSAAAHGELPLRERAAAALDLGQLQRARGRPGAADAIWRDAAALVPDDPELALAAELNRLQLQGATGNGEHRARLQAAALQLAALPDAAIRARHALQLSVLWRTHGQAGAAWLALQQALSSAAAASDHRLQAQALDAQAAAYQSDRRYSEALELVARGIDQARRADAPELLMTLEARAAQLLQAEGDAARALDAWTRAVDHVEAVRADVPVTYTDGRSSFRDSLEPIYLGLADALLRRADGAPAFERQALLRRARDTVDLIKQTELEDWLRDRCGVGSARQDRASPSAGTAIWMPVILPDRLELLLETQAGLTSRRVDIDPARLRDQVTDFVSALRAGQPLSARAQALHRLLVGPLEGELAAQRIHTLLAVPDGVLRLLPLSALHDGRGWLLQRLAVTTVPALSLAPAPRGPAASGPVPLALMAGVSRPGPVLDRLPDDIIDVVVDPPVDARASGSAHGAADGASDPAPRPRDAERQAQLQEALALPGVKAEIDHLASVLPGTVLLDRDFTLDALRQQMLSRRHGIVHIASHGVFGDSAETTFILTWDELLTLDGLQQLLRGRGTAQVELLTLSACQTAEGDDRAPLGMSGSALKARARSALGTLWPVSDEAATRVMGDFYQRLAAGQGTRAQALRRAQLALAADPRRAHPFYWAPFVLIGDWQ